MSYRVYQHKLTGKRICFPNVPQTARMRSAIKFRRKIRHAMQTVDFKVFGTLTYADEFLPASSKHVGMFFNRMRTYERKYNKMAQNFKYVWREDFGRKKGRPHYHFLIDSRVDYDRAVQWWGRGFIWLKAMWSNHQIGQYVAKYMAKTNEEYNGQTMDHARRFGFSAGIPKTPKSDYRVVGLAANFEILQKMVLGWNQKLGHLDMHLPISQKGYTYLFKNE